MEKNVMRERKVITDGRRWYRQKMDGISGIPSRRSEPEEHIE